MKGLTMRAGLWRGLVVGVAVVGSLSALTAGCTTEAYCFSDCEGGAGGTGAIFDAGPDVVVDALPMHDADSGLGHDADNDTSTPCSNDVMTDPAHCGSCDNACSRFGSDATCKAGVCSYTCSDGFTDANKNPADGCECQTSNNGKEICDGIDNNCNGQIDEGIDTKTDVDNCGSCNNKCADVPNATKACVAGTCTWTCKPGFTEPGHTTVDPMGCGYKCPVNPPVAEICNGIDDDCNGTVDDNSPGGGKACQDNCPGGKCQGECKPGSTLCTGTSKGLLCVGGVGPVGEVCDGKDNDCDGKVDNGFDFQNDALNCGGCNIQCQQGDKCVAGKCNFSCAVCTKDIDNNPGNGCEYQCPANTCDLTTGKVTGVETCNGIDDDCNGIIDDNLTDTGTPCAADCPPVDPCVAAGTCSAPSACDATGVCCGECKAATNNCVGGKLVCNHPSFKPDEICNAKDDNCDGRIDEGFDFQNDPLNCGGCNIVCSDPNSVVVQCIAGVCGNVVSCKPGFADVDKDPKNGCEYKCPVFPTMSETCNTIDDDCDGVADDNLTDINQPCDMNCPALDPCVAAGSCTAPSACDSTGTCCGVCSTDGKTQCTAGSLVCKHTAAGPETCNGLDDNCDGRIDEGIDTKTDEQNCGSCGFVCNLPNVTTDVCTGGVCKVGTCATGFNDVDKNPANGCEYACPTAKSAEVCDGIDNDCNGLIDDSPTDVGGACETACPALDPCIAAGTCSAPKSTCDAAGKCCGACVAGAAIACQGGAKVCVADPANKGATLELCNGKDDNCDGLIDEVYDFQNDPLHCGNCTTSCMETNGVAGCKLGKCTIAACDPGYADINKLPGDGCEYKCPVYPPSNVEICNGVDDNCNGQIDEGVVVPANACKTTPGTLCAGVTGSCTAGKVKCNYPAGVEVDVNGVILPSELVCDGIDGNCNGVADETWPNKGLACGTGTGACAGSGTFVCNPAKTGTACNAVAVPANAVDEKCNGIDDDCDGQIDERVPVAGSLCFNGGQHACVGWKDTMAQVNANLWIYSYEASRPGASSTDSGSGTSRACSVPTVLPWASIQEADAATACAAVKDSNGTAMHLCTQAEWQSACTAESGCNDASKALGAPWATGNAATCSSTETAGKAFDMAGNVSEWTSTQVPVNGKTYYQVLGGNYGSQPLATTCGFTFVIEPASFSYADLGFRCCASHAP